MRMVGDRIAHIAIRIPAVAKVKGGIIDALQAHNQMIEKTGRVALGKFGKTGTGLTIDKLKRQIERGDKTFLIWISKREGEFLGFRSLLTTVYGGKPTPEILEAMPPYYNDLSETPQTWYVVETPFQPVDLRLFKLASNGRSLVGVIKECRTASMLVESD
jgi:hypothetical protein